MSQKKQIYGMPVLGRFGLGHRLLAWARCVIWCKENSALMIAPNWYHIPIGPWIRRETDKRWYFLLFNNTNYISGFRRLFLLFTARLTENEAFLYSTNNQERTCIVVFRNAIGGDANKFFSGFIEHHQFLKHELEKITKPQYLPKLIAIPHIAIHVRLGDFANTPLEKLHQGVHNARLPIEWYVSMLEGLRERLEYEVPALIYSDGTDSDLQQLLSLKNVCRADGSKAITHLLAMSQAKILIGTGSGMTLWGALLGQVPRICFTGQKYVQVLKDSDLEVEFEYKNQISSSFIELIKPNFRLR
jgi:hypothetical protein